MPLNHEGTIADRPGSERPDDALLRAILEQPIGTQANIVQAAYELGDLRPEWSLYERLYHGFQELTDETPVDPDEMIRLREDEEDGDAAL